MKFMNGIYRIKKRCVKERSAVMHDYGDGCHSLVSNCLSDVLYLGGGNLFEDPYICHALQGLPHNLGDMID